MKTVKGIGASARQKMQDVTAKTEEKYEITKASAAEKTEKFLAPTKAGKEEAHARKHAKEAEAGRNKEQKLAENVAQKHEFRRDVLQRDADAHAALANPNTVVHDANQGIAVPGNPYVSGSTAATQPGYSEQEQNFGTTTTGLTQDQTLQSGQVASNGYAAPNSRQTDWNSTY